ncbi:outer membrane protein [Glycocaulis alkaliphilus]|uniref:outer membrane protein n=1 Tax=Glycocaulis alkaliphilus TaxID=1434191 RepID=UPI001F19F3E8|nr:outer membrane protein [Glycocaulis alkaliphilus]
MKKRLLTAAAVGAFLALPSVAAAQEGWYVRGALGYGAPGDSDVSGIQLPVRRISGKSSVREALALGYQFDGGFRADLELAHRYNNTGAIGNLPQSASSVHAWSVMLTGIYEFNQGGWARPYVGAGAGIVDSYFSGAGLLSTNVPFTVRDNDQSFAYHALAGVAFSLTQNLMLDVEYRYFGYGRTNYDTPYNVSVNALRGHEAWAGLRYVFAAPAAVAPPPRRLRPAASAAASAPAASAGMRRRAVRGVLRVGSRQPDGSSPSSGQQRCQ